MTIDELLKLCEAKRRHPNSVVSRATFYAASDAALPELARRLMRLRELPEDTLKAILLHVRPKLSINQIEEIVIAIHSELP